MTTYEFVMTSIGVISLIVAIAIWKMTNAPSNRKTVSAGVVLITVGIIGSLLTNIVIPSRDVVSTAYMTNFFLLIMGIGTNLIVTAIVVDMSKNEKDITVKIVPVVITGDLLDLNGNSTGKIAINLGGDISGTVVAKK